MSKDTAYFFLKRIIPVLFLLFFFQIIIGSAVFFLASLHETRAYLHQQIDRVKEDVKYDNGKWDTSQYNADGDIPSINPLYIITSDGFVIDRWRPIHGLLDASEFTRILTYTSPQTINTITNENWRVLSKPISSNNEIVGAILVTAYRPNPDNLDATDTQLAQTIEDIQQTIFVQGETVNVSKFDPRKLQYDITYQIVNKFNKIVAQSDNINSITRTPTFIDTSYIDNQLKTGNEEQVVDSVTKQKYLVETIPFYNNRHEVIGIIVAGAKIDSLYTNLTTHLESFAGISGILLLLVFPILLYVLNESVKYYVRNNSVKKDPSKISFEKKESKLLIDTTSIAIPYASYQFYFCDALFSKPQKRWEVDELIEKFGENPESGSWRKVYDTMVALNKKIADLSPTKLFVVHNKTYRINPSLLSKISS